MSNADAPAATPRRDQIRREAARLFAARGFLGVGVDEIGRAVGISGPGLYRHFAGKDAMLADLLVGISERLLGEGRRRVQETAAAGEALDALILGHIDFALDDQDLITLHDRELLHLRDEDRHRVRRLQRGYVELWVDVVRRAFPAPSALAAEPGARAAVHAVFGLLNSTPHSAGQRGVQPSLDRPAMAALLHRLALGAFQAAAAPDNYPEDSHPGDSHTRTGGPAAADARPDGHPAEAPAADAR
ncbi:TetR/AcrR family transcriptional regulator [Streptomyces sp. NPDC092296]|uniref:SACE_7040 family transcriptional regulator n=1 Tax=Streptomyces sp. NPDC092296 TaxID=3366012 RepID=UPI0038279E3A